jgi:hypothetical protein
MTNAPTTIRHIRLEPLPDGFARGRQSLHQLAFFAIAPKRYQDTGRLGLRHTGTGFGTPGFDPGEQIWVEDDRIVRQRGENTRSARVTTLAKACEFLGIPYREQWFDRFHDPLAPVGADARLDIEPGVARALDAWQEFARVALEEARRLGAPGDDVTELQLWPEHFDQAFEMGSQAEGRRASYGASPGDDQHPEPYLYVAPWLRAERNDPYWNDPAFSGASLPYAELLTSRDPVGLAHGFFARGFSLLSR